eukprot:12921898-Prorocentrum_lima.AAC.1
MEELGKPQLTDTMGKKLQVSITTTHNLSVPGKFWRKKKKDEKKKSGIRMLSRMAHNTQNK